MVLNHLVGLYVQPKKEWQLIDKNNESLIYGLSHVLFVALVPALLCYYSGAYLGWSIGVGEPIMLSKISAMVVSILIYVGLIAGVVVLAVLINWMAKTFDSQPNYTQSLEMAAYAATPLFMSGLAALYPELWFVVMVGLVGLAYSVYLLYVGVPIIMHIPEEKGFIYSSSVVTCGLVLLISLMVSSILLWNAGLGELFS